MSTLLTSTPTKGAIARHLLDKQLRAFGVALPGTVMSYDADTRTATVRPGVHRLVPSLTNEDEDLVEELPPLQDVPVCWPMGRGFAFADVSLAAGDPVLLICLDRDASGWRRTGAPAEPEDARAHHWGSAVAIPGLAPRQNPVPVPSDAAALASKLDTFLRTISALANTVTPGSAETATAAIITAARAAVGGSPGVPGTGTVGSSVLKLED